MLRHEKHENPLVQLTLVKVPFYFVGAYLCCLGCIDYVAISLVCVHAISLVCIHGAIFNGHV